MREKNKAKRRNGPIGLTENEKDGAREKEANETRDTDNTEEERVERRPKYDEEKHQQERDATRE